MTAPTPFGRMLRNARKAAGMTLADVATPMGLSVPYMSELERGNRDAMAPERHAALATAIPGLTLEAVREAWEATRYPVAAVLRHEVRRLNEENRRLRERVRALERTACDHGRCL